VGLYLLGSSICLIIFYIIGAKLNKNAVINEGNEKNDIVIG
jgi:hypothetical protein